MTIDIHQKKIFCLIGPTATGKTSLSIELSLKHPFEIINVDSAKVYKYMNIGTAKPTSEQLKIIPHHLIDICNPQEIYSVGSFYDDALSLIEKIFNRNKFPLFVGGSMLYFKSLQYGISSLPKVNKDIREKISLDLYLKGKKYLFDKLKKIDPEIANTLNKNDIQRIQRAIEVYEQTGNKLSYLQKSCLPNRLKYKTINFIVAPQSHLLLKDNIEKRFNNMINLGFIDEVNMLYNKKYLNKNLPSSKIIGYKQILDYLDGNITYNDILKLIPNVTQQLAKRQMTWLRSIWKNNSYWFDYDDNNLNIKINDIILSEMKL